jgi:hypothetical protein
VGWGCEWDEVELARCLIVKGRASLRTATTMVGLFDTKKKTKKKEQQVDVMLTEIGR